MQTMPANSLPVQTVEFKKNQLAILGAGVTVLFAILTFIVNYVEKATGDVGSSGNVVSILNQQTAILSRMEATTSDTHKILTDRTIGLNETKASASTNGVVLAGISALLTEQAKVLTKQTEVLQKLSVWLDMQIQTGKVR